MEISSRLQEERKRLGLTQEGLAERLGATKRSVINWEGGAALPGAEVLAKYAAAGANVRYILEGPPPPLHERLDTALATAGLPTAEAAAKALKVSLKDMRAMLAGKLALAEALHEPLRKLNVDLRYVLEGDGGDRSQADHALNPAEAKLLRDYRASNMDVQAALRAAAQAGAAANKKV